MKIFYILPFLLSCQIGLAQRTTFSVGLNSGFSQFFGKSAVKSASVMTPDPLSSGLPRASNRLGGSNAATFGASVSVSREFKNHFLLGLEAGYEMLRSRTDIEVFQVDDMLMQTDGYNINNNKFINLFPSAGYDFLLGEKVRLAVTGGADFGIGLSSKSKLVVPEHYDNMYSNNEGLVPGLDFRPRAQIKVSGDRLGLALSYAHGITNWLNGWAGGATDLHMRAWRIGVQYRIF
jgi:hypothetical protein